MAKKPEKLTLKDLISSQKEQKLGMSASILSQLKSAAGSEPADTGSTAKPEVTAVTNDKAIQILQDIHKSISITMSNQLANIAKAIQKNTASIAGLATGRNPDSGKKIEKAKSDQGLTEDDLEQQEFQNKDLRLLGKIEENTRKDKAGKKEEGFFESLGKWGKLLALAIGGFIGVLQAKIRAIKYFIELLVPDALIMRTKKIFSNIGSFFEDISKGMREKVGGVFGKVGKFVEDFLGKIKGIFSEDNVIVKTFKGIMKFVGKFTAPFIEAFNVLKGLTSGPVGKIGELFGSIGRYFGSFARVIGKIAGIVGKLFLPITIIMSVWDTVKGAIEGFSKDGIIGGIKGAITGLVNSLIFGPLDLIKDAIAWILGIFGFDNAKKLLDSFSLEEVFKGFMDAVFKPVEMIRDIFFKIVDWFKNLEIPSIGFSAFGKSFKMGPWKPFASDKKEGEAAKAETPATPATTKPGEAPTEANVQPSIAPPQAANRVYDRSAEVAPSNRQNGQANQTTVVNAPTQISNKSQTNAIRVNITDQDPSIRSYYRSRFVT
jgi:hypothetical protein